MRDGTEGIEQLCLQPGLQDQQIHVDLLGAKRRSSPASRRPRPSPTPQRSGLRSSTIPPRLG